MIFGDKSALYYWALVENYRMSTCVTGFRLFPSFLSSFYVDQVSQQPHNN